MGKFVISESERREILALHESYKKSLLQEQGITVPDTLPQTNQKLTELGKSLLQNLVNFVKTNEVKNKVIKNYGITGKLGKLTPEQYYDNWYKDYLLSAYNNITFEYDDKFGERSLGQFQTSYDSEGYLNGGKLLINPYKIVESAKKQNVSPSEELSRVLTHELRHFIFASMSERYFIPDDYQDLMQGKNKVIPVHIVNNVISGNSPYIHGYTSSNTEIMARMEKFRKDLGLDYNRKYSAQEMKNIITTKFKSAFEKFPQLTREEFDRVKNLPKQKRKNDLSSTSKILSYMDETDMVFDFWYKGNFMDFLKGFNNAADDTQWMMNQIITYKLEGYFYIDYEIAAHVHDYFVSVEKGDIKNVG
jgi:predicted SprT family Zn-dependent metalloprotease